MIPLEVVALMQSVCLLLLAINSLTLARRYRDNYALIMELFHRVAKLEAVEAVSTERPHSGRHIEITNPVSRDLAQEAREALLLAEASRRSAV